MNIEEDEIKQINEIFNKLNSIQDDEWQRKEGETEEEYNARIESIEEELEEELLDYISDSLLVEQKINEEEVLKEAEEKIKNDYELFSDAFVENEDGTITLKSEEELIALGYSTPEEIERLEEIENNRNNLEQYLNNIKESIKASKDIDSEIDRKMELVKSIISAKKRGETIPISLNPNVEKDKFEKANEYIANTITLKRIPTIQNEYINNNYISEIRYNNVMRNINNTTNRVATTLVQTAPIVVIPTQKIVTQRIPERKNEVYANLEQKLNKNNILTKQKIKARTELKRLFKEFEDKQLTIEELDELNSKIESIKNKYPNIVTDKILDKLYDTFKVKLPTETTKQQLQNVESAKQDNEVESTQTEVMPKTVSENPVMSREKLIESLKKAERYNTRDTHAKGINLLVINKLISYLKDNDDLEIQERLNKEIAKLQTDRLDAGELYIYNYKLTDLQTLNYMYEKYRDGVKSADGSREIIPVNQNAASYYLYLTHNICQQLSEKGENTNPDIAKDIDDDFSSNAEETCYRYFEFLKEKYNIDKLKGMERLKAEYYFISELKQAKEIKGNTEYLNLAIAKEFVTRPRENSFDISEEQDFKKKKQIFEAKINNGEKIEAQTLKLLGNMYYHGLKTVIGEDMITQDKRKAVKIYEQIINEKGISADAEIYSNLIDIYSDNTTPLYDKSKADKLLEIATKKGLHIEEKSIKQAGKESFTYVCSDLHGEYSAYQAITSQLKENDKLYILGDAIDRGEDGIKILQDVMKRKEQGQVEFLIGNHELMMIQSLFLGDEKQKQIWTSTWNGGDITLKAFEKLNSVEQSKIKDFLFDSYVYKNINVDSQNVHLVHAKSIQDKNDNRDKTLREMLAERKEELIKDAVWSRATDGSGPHKESAKTGMFTVIGHSPTKNNMIEYKNGYLNIDCGAGNDEIASLVNLTSGTVKYISVRHEREKEISKQKER